MGFWRHIDPRLLTTAELVPASTEVERYSQSLLPGAYNSPYLVSTQARMLLHGLASTQTRYDAMTGLWLQMRSSCSIRRLGVYALYFLCWLEARPFLEKDPVFGELVPDLYAYTAHHFGCVALSPPNDQTLAAAAASLQSVFLCPNPSLDASYLSVRSTDLFLERLLDQPQSRCLCKGTQDREARALRKTGGKSLSARAKTTFRRTKNLWCS